MKKIKLFIMETCPYCMQARSDLQTLLQNPRYAGLEIELIDEIKEAKRAAEYDYYYVPTFYLEDTKVSEGAVTKEKIAEILEAAL